MARIKGTNTRPERLLRAGLHRAGLRFRLHRKDLPGKPDIVLPKYRAAVFVHGCFWHQHPRCRDAAKPKTRPEFWAEKLKKNRLRDRRQIQALLKDNWRVLVVWECALRTTAERREAATSAALHWILGRTKCGEISRSIGQP